MKVGVLSCKKVSIERCLTIRLPCARWRSAESIEIEFVGALIRCTCMRIIGPDLRNVIEQ